MKNIIFAPWRMEYILSDKTGPCLFCKVFSQDVDKQNLVLYRGKHSFIIMNLYPYNNGHLMITSNKHVATIRDLNDQTRMEMMKLLASSERILKEIMSPHGFNVGINIGEAAGAGIREHIHIHIVPRWIGDTNFFTALSETRAIPESLQATYDKLLPSFDKLDLQ